MCLEPGLLPVLAPPPDLQDLPGALATPSPLKALLKPWCPRPPAWSYLAATEVGQVQRRWSRLTRRAQECWAAKTFVLGSNQRLQGQLKGQSEGRPGHVQEHGRVGCIAPRALMAWPAPRWRGRHQAPLDTGKPGGDDDNSPSQCQGWRGQDATREAADWLQIRGLGQGLFREAGDWVAREACPEQNET